MKGSVFIKACTKNESFEITLNRKVTILRGDSGIGKTVFHNILRDYFSKKNLAHDLDVNIDGCDKIIFPSPTNPEWGKEVCDNRNCVVFIDEDNSNVLTDGDIGGVISRSDNYFLIITRKPPIVIDEENEDFEDDLVNLSQSVEGTLTLVSSIVKTQSSTGKEINYYVNRAVPLYGKIDMSSIPDLVIVEDSKSGYQFFSSTLNRDKVKVVSAKSKTRALGTLMKSALSGKYKSIYLLVDSENFGFEAHKVVQAINTKEFKQLGVDVNVSDIRSFKYLLLESVKVFKENISNILDNTENYCDCSVYNNWEKFYTSLLNNGYIRERGEDGMVFMSSKFTRISDESWYDKSDLNRYFLSKNIVESIYKSLRDLDSSLIKE